MKRIAVHGIKDDIACLIGRVVARMPDTEVVDVVERSGRVQYDNGLRGVGVEMSRDVNNALLDDIARQNLDVLVVANAAGYMDFFAAFAERRQHQSMPRLVVFTGGGPDLIDKVKTYTPYVLPVPQPIPEYQALVREASTE